MTGNGADAARADPGSRPPRGLKKLRHAALVRSEAGVQWFERRFGRHPLVQAGRATMRVEKESGGGLLAGAIAFRFFCFVVPFSFVIVFGLGLASNAAGQDPTQLARKSGITGLAASAVQAGANASTTTQWVTLAVACWALFSASTSFVKALWVAHALIWRMPLRRRRHPALSGLAFILAV